MKSLEFYQAIREGEFVETSFPVRGTNAFYPHGKALLTNIETKIHDKLKVIPYESVELPEIVPAALVAHLREQTLFKVENSARLFYLAGSAEMQSAFLGKHLAKTYRDLPLLLFSRSKVRREGDTTSLIYDLEFISNEFNFFYCSPEEARNDWNNMHNLFSGALEQLHIPHVSVSQGEENRSPKILFAYYPFSKTFGSVFWSNILSETYVQSTDFTFQTKKNTVAWPVHLNGGFTSRMLGTYLANHEDAYGFILDSNITPYDVLLPRDYEESKNGRFVQTIASLEFKKRKAMVNNHEQLNKKFAAMGIPVLVEEGKHEIGITTRKSLNKQWINPDDTRQVIYTYLSSYIHDEPAPIPKEILDKPHNPGYPYEDGVIYIVPPEQSASVADGSLKYLGNTPEGKCFVTKKY